MGILFPMGFGFFKFKPNFGKSYKTVVEYNGQTKTFDLPTVLTEGYVLQVIYFLPPKDRTATLEFFTADRATEYEVRLEGVTDAGKILVENLRFRVE